MIVTISEAGEYLHVLAEHTPSGGYSFADGDMTLDEFATLLGVMFSRHFKIFWRRNPHIWEQDDFEANRMRQRYLARFTVTKELAGERSQEEIYAPAPEEGLLAIHEIKAGVTSKDKFVVPPMMRFTAEALDKAAENDA